MPNFKHEADKNAMSALDNIAAHMRRRRMAAKLEFGHHMPHASPDPQEESAPEGDVNLDGAGHEEALAAKLHEVRRSMMGSHEEDGLQSPNTAPDHEEPASEEQHESADQEERDKHKKHRMRI